MISVLTRIFVYACCIALSVFVGGWLLAISLMYFGYPEHVLVIFDVAFIGLFGGAICSICVYALWLGKWLQERGWRQLRWPYPTL
jgi:hypothetical protein